MKKDLATALADRGLVKMTDHFLPRRRYRGAGGWMCSMQRDGKRVTGRGDYILSTDRRSFFNVWMQETSHDRDYRLILVVLQGEVALHNRHYQQERTFWPIRPKAVRLHIEG